MEAVNNNFLKTSLKEVQQKLRAKNNLLATRIHLAISAGYVVVGLVIAHGLSHHWLLAMMVLLWSAVNAWVPHPELSEKIKNYMSKKTFEWFLLKTIQMLTKNGILHTQIAMYRGIRFSFRNEHGTWFITKI